jgi:hypothetical protein
MKKQINPTIKAHLIRGAAYVLLLLAVCVIPLALAQRNAKQSAAAGKMSRLSSTASRSQLSPLTSARAQAARIPAMPASQVPKTASASRLSVPVATGLEKRVSEVPLKASGASRVQLLPILPQPKAPQVVLYDQYDNAGTNSTSSQNFEPASDPFDDFNADDFVVPSGETWNIEEVDVLGVYFNGFGPADSFNVFIYQDSGTLPGTLVYSATDLAYTSADNLNFVIPLTVAATLTEGTYWVSVQCNMDFSVGGQWGWTDRTVQSNSEAAWQNPNGGFGVCLTWGHRGTDCGIDPGVPDQVYRLNGTIGGGGTPTPTPTGTPGGCIVVNGGFETGDFTGWTQFGDTSFTAVDISSPGGTPPHSGSFLAYFGPLTDGGIMQTLTAPAGTYTVDFWLAADGGDGGDFINVTLGGVTIYTAPGSGSFGFTHITGTATVGADPVLEFHFVNVPSFWDLDDVCVTPGGGGTPTPTPTASPTPSGTPACSPGPLWYNGDFDGVDGLTNEQDTFAPGYSHVYDDFNVNDPGGWDVASVFSDDLANTNITSATWEIRQGVSAGNPGTLVASGVTLTPVITPTGRSGFGFTEFMVEVTGLSVHLDPGTYWLNVTPVDNLDGGRSFDSTTSGANCIGTPCGDNANSFWDSDLFGVFFVPTSDAGAQFHDFSMGVNGTVGGGCPSPTPTPSVPPVTPTPTPTITPTPSVPPVTPTPTPTITPTPSVPPVTPTPTPTETPRPTPTPRPRPTPHPRP